MTTEKTDTRDTNWLMTAMKVLFCIAAFVIVTMMILMNMGGNSDVFRDSIQDYISESTGYHATIKKFNGMTFFPVIGLDFEDLELRTAPQETAIAAGAGKIHLAFDFWDVVTGNGQVRYFNMEDAHAVPGVFTTEDIRLERAHIAEANEGPSAFKGQGTIGDRPFSFEMVMDTLGKGRNKNFRFGKDRKNFSMNVGDAHAQGAIETVDGGVRLQDLALSVGGRQALKADINITKTNGPDVNVTGTLVFMPRMTTLNPEISFRRKDGFFVLKGKISGDAVYAQDLDGKSAFVEFLQFVENIFGNSRDKQIVLTAPLLDADVTLDFARLVVGDDDKGPFTQAVRMKKSDLVIRPRAALMETYSIRPIPVRAAPPL